MRGKLLLLILSGFLMALSLYSQKNIFELTASLDDPDANQKNIYLLKLDSNAKLAVIDSTSIIDNLFMFSGVVEETTPALLFVSIPTNFSTEASILAAAFIAESGKIALSLGETARVGGTPQNEKLQSFLDLQESLYQESITDLESNGSKSNELASNQRNSIYDFIKSNIKNDVGEYIMMSSHEALSTNQKMELLSQTRSQFANSEQGRSFTLYVEGANMLETKGKYKDMQLLDLDGNKAFLSNYVEKNRVVLISFLASWCEYSAKELPILKKAYAEYKEQGLEIVSISLDTRVEDWSGFIKKHNLGWPQLSDLRGTNSDVVKSYVVSKTPSFVLIDENGMIIDSGLEGEKLYKKIQEQFK